MTLLPVNLNGGGELNSFGCSVAHEHLASGAAVGGPLGFALKPLFAVRVRADGGSKVHGSV